MSFRIYYSTSRQCHQKLGWNDATRSVREYIARIISCPYLESFKIPDPTIDHYGAIDEAGWEMWLAFLHLLTGLLGA